MERQYGKKSVTLCPSCSAGNWIAYSTNEWRISTPKFVGTCTQKEFNWMRDRSKLVKEKLPHVKREEDYLNVKEEEVIRELKRKGYDISDKENEELTECENLPPKRRVDQASPARTSRGRSNAAVRDFIDDYNEVATSYLKKFRSDDNVN